MGGALRTKGLTAPPRLKGDRLDARQHYAKTYPGYQRFLLAWDEKLHRMQTLTETRNRTIEASGIQGSHDHINVQNAEWPAHP